MTDSESTLAALLPEIFPIVASHLPLYTQPSTLLSLALTDHRLNEIVIPRLLYQKVWLEGEERALKVLRSLKAQAESTDKGRILQGSDIPIAHHVHRLCISSELSPEARENKVDTISELRELIEIGGLFNLVSLAIHMGEGWYVDMDNDYERFDGFGRLDRSFWASLQEKCPKLKEISLTGVTDFQGDRWVEESGLYEYQGLESFRLQYRRHHPGEPDESTAASGLERLFDSLTTSSPLLHTLELIVEDEELIDTTAKDGLFTRRFPHLRVLTLNEFTIESPEVASEFWSSHPYLERVEISDVLDAGSWFNGLTHGNLPKLTILKAPFPDVRALLPILGDQLINLTISSSINAQVPFLLRSVLPNGLASLRSLGIYQRGSNHTREIIWEGSRWHEDEDGNISEVSKKKSATLIDASYIISLARGAPNLQELELIGESKPPIELITKALSNFSKLKRLYLSESNHGIYQPFIPPEDKHTLLEIARVFAQDCETLESITEVAHDTRNVHVTAKIQRNADKSFSLNEERGFGRVIGLGDNDYPGFI